MNRMCLRILRANALFQKHDASLLTIFKTSYQNLISRRNAIVKKTWEKFSLGTALKVNALISSRGMSSSSSDDDKKKPNLLMSFDPVMRPEILLTIKNWILAKFIIQPYLDRDFTLKDFTLGTKQALGVVSSLLSQGDFQSLKGLVTDEVITEVKKNFASLNLKERQDILVKVTDILFAFPFQVGIIFDDNNQKRFAEITVVYHCLNDFEDLKQQGKVLAEDSKEDFKICNYRFIREYTKGVQSDWIINRLGHFKLTHFEN